jgi:hypothetical protein
MIVALLRTLTRVRARTDFNDVALGARDLYAIMAERVRRTTAIPALVRVAASAAAFVGLALALPDEAIQLPLLWVLVFGASALVGLAPRSRMTTIVIMFAVLAWLTRTIWFQPDTGLWRLMLLTAALYVAHTGAALASVLPYDALVSPGVAARWLRRSAIVVGASLVLELVMVTIAGQLQPVSLVVLPVLGIIMAAGLAAVLAWLLRRG